MDKKERPIKVNEGLKNAAVTLLTTFGSVLSICFGLWHFFVPGIWNWYAYIDNTATELIIAVRAINIFFSLMLVWLGVTCILFVFRKPVDKFSTTVILAMSCILWLTRVVLQIICPQGSQQAIIQYTMLFTFLMVFACFAVSLYLVSMKRSIEL